MELPGLKSNNKAIIWIAGGCLVISICAIISFLSGLAGFFWSGPPVAKEVEVDWEIPTGIDIGEDVEFRVAVTNISTAPVELTEVDFTMDYLHGFIIETTNPPYIDSYQYSALGGGETYQTYFFRQPIAPGETLTITLNGKAVIRGDYSGMMGVCINSTVNCRNNAVRTIIR